MNKFNPDIDYSMRTYNSIIQAIKEFISFQQLQKVEQNKWEEEFNKIKTGDSEAIKIYRDMKFDKDEVKKIIKITERIIQEKEKRDTQMKKDKDKSFDNRIKQASQSFNKDYIDFAEEFFEIQPYFYDKSKIWWLWNSKDSFWEMIDETTLLNEIYDSCKVNGIKITSSSVKSEIKTSMEMVGRRHQPEEAPVKWVQFKDKAFSVKSNEIYDVKPNYFFTNPIPWELGTTSDTPFMDKLFSEWVGKDHLKDLYEFIAYCCYRAYPIQLLFCLYGHGRNGKSTFINIVDKFLGTNNTCTTDLDMIAGRNKNRFESFRLFKKLACFMGETNFNMLENSSMLKKLVGGDKIGFEVKGKNPFDDYNYAKIIIASNSLPSSEDTSEGFYRRWHIIDFPNEFPEGNDVSLNVPEQEFRNLAKKVTEILPNMLKTGKFSNQGSIAERKAKYIMASNPIPYFIEHFCYLRPEGYIRYGRFYKIYTQFLSKMKRRIVSKLEFSRILNAEGLEVRKTSKEGEIDRYVEGIQLKDEFEGKDFSSFSSFSLK